MRKKFKVLIHGRNYLLHEHNKGSRKYGFYTTVFIEAMNSEGAESMAIEMLKNDSKLLNTSKNSDSDRPTLSVESTDEIASFENCTIPRAGLILYAEDGSSNTGS